MSGGLFGWIGDGLAEIASQLTGVFKSDDVSGSNSGETQGTTTSRNQERGRASYLQGQDLERYTEQQLDEFGLNALWDKNNLVYDETLEQYGKTTQVDVLIRDGNDNEVAIIECKAYTSKWNDDDAVDQARRLVSLANERGIPLIFSTYDGTTDCFGSRVKEVLNQTQYFVISSDNIFFADPSDVKENGVTQGLPPELRDHYDGAGGGGGEALLGGLISSFVGFFGDSSKSESSVTSDHSRNDSENHGDSWFGNWFGDNSEPESSNSSDHNSSDSENKGDSWFGNWFGDSSESESSNSSNSSSIDSDSRESSDYGSSDYGSVDYGDSGDSGSSSSSSDSGDSDYGSSDYGSDDYGDSGRSDSSSSSSDSGDSDYGSSDYGSGDYGDSSGSDSSSSSSDSWW